MYKATEAAGGAQPGAEPHADNGSEQQPNAGGENVTDAEFEEVK
jgi:molecular chaperone DnaK